MRSYRQRPVGWRGESHRHYLAAKGISRYFSPVFVYRRSLGGKHKGNERNNEVRGLYGPSKVKDESSSMEGNMKYAFDTIDNDHERDVDEIRVTDPDDMIIYQWKRGGGTVFPDKNQMFPREYDGTLSKDKLRVVKRLRDDAE